MKISEFLHSYKAALIPW